MLKGDTLGAIAVVLLGAAALAVVDASRRDDDRAGRDQEFQRLVGGLGMGPAIDLGDCMPDFDPRLGAPCSRNLDPIPGAAGFCPHRGGAALVR